MRYVFFFSYARINHDQYLLRFYEDLKRRVLVQWGPSEEELAQLTDIGFLDENNLELGADWGQNIFEALQASRVLICAYSPSYFVSEYCSREWHVFQMRRRSYSNLPGQGALPPAIKPIIWVWPKGRMEQENVHEEVRQVQYTLGATNAVHNTLGVERMVRMMNRYTVEYEEFLTDLADAIISAAELNPPLPELPPPLPRLSEITPLFPLKRPAPHAPPVQQPQPATVFPEHQNPLVFACVQLNPAGGAPNLEAPPWRPFGADGATIDYITQGIAVRDLNTSCEVDQIDTIAELSDLIKRASARSQTLVILADAGNAAEIIQAGVDLAHYPLFVLGQPGAIPMGPAPGANLAATVDALRAILIDQVPRLQSRMRALAKADLPSPIGKPIISASNG